MFFPSPLRHRRIDSADFRFGNAIAVGIVGCIALGGCAIVPAYDREYLADPTMQTTVDPLESRATRKLHTSREGASGGDGNSAGGGCGCSN